jgi:phosphate:Na+ symporter
MPFSLIEGAIGGIGLFLLGMRLMSDGIRTVADARIRRFFFKCTSNRIFSLLFGLSMALAVNSGSASVVFTIGLVNAGVLNTFQAMSVLGGVLIGSSLILHLPPIPYNLIATPLVLSGVLLKFFARRRRLANFGDLMLGIGLLFMGLTLLEGSYRPGNHHPLYEAFNGIFYRVPLLAALFGTLVSFLVQSVSSSVSIISSLAHHQHVTPLMSGSMVAGGVIGVAAMGCLATVGGSCIARRIALLLLMISTCVTVLFVLLYPLLLPVIPHEHSLPTNGQLYAQLSWVHSAVSVVTALCAVALSGPISRLVASAELSGSCGQDTAESSAGYLDLRIINTPTIAIEQVRKEIMRMMSLVSYMYADITEIVFEFDARRAETIRQHEKVLDSLNHEISSFLASLSRATKNPDINYEAPGLLQTVTSLEHIGDRCEEILDSIVARKNGGVLFSDVAMEDLKGLITMVGSVLRAAEQSVKSGHPLAADELYQLKRDARTYFDDVKQSHFERISSGVCSPQALMIFNDMTSSFAAIVDICWNVLSRQVRRPNEQ